MAPAPSIAASLILLTKLIIYRENPAKFPETNASLQARTRAARGIHYIFPLYHWDLYRKTPAKNHSMGPSVRPNFFMFYSFFISIMSPAPPIAAALILTALLLIEKTPRKCQFGKKSAKVNHSLYSSTEQLQVALRTYIFLWFGLNKEKSIHILPLRSVPFLSLHL